MSGLLILLGLIDAVVLFLMNEFATSYIVNALSTTCIFVIVLGILSLWWSIQETKYLTTTDDEWGEGTDNFLGR
jgi:TM2 domain-containing membrane protein YozV